MFMMGCVCTKGVVKYLHEKAQTSEICGKGWKYADAIELIDKPLWQQQGKVRPKEQRVLHEDQF